MGGPPSPSFGPDDATSGPRPPSPLDPSDREGEAAAAGDAREALLIHAELVEDVLEAHGEVGYARLEQMTTAESSPTDDAGDRWPATTPEVAFVVISPPVHDLDLELLLRPDVQEIRLNGHRFISKRPGSTELTVWIEQRCRDVERLLGQELRLTSTVFLGMPEGAVLETRVPPDGPAPSKPGRGKWHELARISSGLVGVATTLAPWSFLFSRRKVQVFRQWWLEPGEDDAAGEVTGDEPPPPDDAADLDR